jgi:hypothetical protein
VGYTADLRQTIFAASMLAMNSCAYIGHSKGLVINSHLDKTNLPLKDDYHVNVAPEMDISIVPYLQEEMLSVGPCILIPIPVLPNPMGIFRAIRDRKKWEIADDKLKVRISFWRAAPGVYQVRPKDLRLRIDSDMLEPEAVKVSCSDRTSTWSSKECPAPVSGSYTYEKLKGVSDWGEQFEITFPVPASSVDKASLIIAGALKDGHDLQAPPLLIARRKYFSLGCVLGEGSEWHFYTH